MREWLTRQLGGAPYWLLLLAPIALILTVALVVPSAVRAAPSTSGPLPTYTATPAPTAVPFTVPEQPRLLVFGDSYTQGFAATPQTRGYAYLVGERLGWPIDVRGVGGTGFTYGGPDGGENDYISRLRTYIRTSTFKPNVIVLEGSQNDYRSVAKIGDAVITAVGLLRAAYPGARIVLFGPAAPQPLQADLAPIDAADEAAAAQLGIPYISPYQAKWITTANTARYGYSDGSHLNTAGHAYLADRFLTDFRPLFRS